MEANFLSRWYKWLTKRYGWVIILLLTVAIKWLSLYPQLVEKYYTYGIYPLIAKIQRILFGWIPISIGDLLYAAAFIFLGVKMAGLVRAIFRKKLSRSYLSAVFQSLLFGALTIYVVFNLCWGLNYNRLGISHQLDLKEEIYNAQDLEKLCETLQGKLNELAEQTHVLERDSFYSYNKNVFNHAHEAYKKVSKEFSVWQYEPKSIKKSLVGFLGKFIGFYGYYNPFTGEGQITTSIPVFLQPYVATHEIAHQLGYAKENEANFVGFLAAKNSPRVDFRYSGYYDMYSYSIAALRTFDSVKSNRIHEQLHPTVVADRQTYIDYMKKIRNNISPVMLKLYDRFLRMNNQPKGYLTYNEVVIWLVAYAKKFGWDKI